MDFKKLNEQLERFIINELDKSTMDNAFQKRFDNYINSKNVDDKEVNWNKLEKHKNLRKYRDEEIGKIKNDFASLFGEDLTGQTYNQSIKIDHMEDPFESIKSLKGLPEILNGDLTLRWLTTLENFDYLPKKIKGTLVLDCYKGQKPFKAGDTEVTTFHIKNWNKVDIVELPKFKNLEIFNSSYSDHLITKSIEIIPGNLVATGHRNFEVPVAKKVLGNCKISDYCISCCPEYVEGDVIIIGDYFDNFEKCSLRYVGGDLILDYPYTEFNSKILQGLQNIDIKGKIKILDIKFTKALYLQAKKLGLLNKIEGIDSFDKEPENLTPEQSITKEFFAFCKDQNIKASYDLYDRKVIINMKGFSIKIQFRDSSKETIDGKDTIILGNFYFPGQKDVWVGRGPYSLTRFQIDLNNQDHTDDFKKGLKYISSIADKKFERKK